MSNHPHEKEAVGAIEKPPTLEKQVHLGRTKLEFQEDEETGAKFIIVTTPTGLEIKYGEDDQAVKALLKEYANSTLNERQVADPINFARTLQKFFAARGMEVAGPDGMRKSLVIAQKMLTEYAVIEQQLTALRGFDLIQGLMSRIEEAIGFDAEEFKTLPSPIKKAVTDLTSVATIFTLNQMATPEALASAQRMSQIRMLNNQKLIDRAVAWGTASGTVPGKFLGALFAEGASGFGNGMGGLFGEAWHSFQQRRKGKHPATGSGQIIENNVPEKPDYDVPTPKHEEDDEE